MKTAAKVLFFAPSSHGGLAEYSLCQAQALQSAGVKIVCLTDAAFLDGRKTGFEKVPCLPNPILPAGNRNIRKLKMAWQVIASRMILAIQIIKHRPDLVLLDSYVEYFSPVWVWPHWLLASLAGVKYAANLHDPVRSYVVGPRWWHRMSMRLAYLPLNFVLVHEKLSDPSPVPARICVVQVPHGLYEISGEAPDPAAVRRAWGIREGEKVFLAFGYVRDGKNLELAVRALAQVPKAVLIIAGAVASTKDKPFAFYRELATELGVAERCHFFEGFVADDALGKYFAGTDFVMLTYSSAFHSQSGVLNLAARARKPVLASASPSSLIESVKNYDLGIAVAPDLLEEVVGGMRRLIDKPPQPRWDDYEAAASWSVNAVEVLQAAGLGPIPMAVKT